MSETVDEFNYDELVAAFERARCETEPSYVICRSVEEAAALAQWCHDNGFDDVGSVD